MVACINCLSGVQCTESKQAPCVLYAATLARSAMEVGTKQRGGTFSDRTIDPTNYSTRTLASITQSARPARYGRVYIYWVRVGTIVMQLLFRIVLVELRALRYVRYATHHVPAGGNSRYIVRVHCTYLVPTHGLHGACALRAGNWPGTHTPASRAG